MESIHPDADAMRALLRAHHTGTLSCDGRVFPSRFVIDGASGRIVLPVPREALECDSLVLHVPEEGEGALELLLVPRPIDPDREGACDRWQAYHGRPREARWASCAIESARRAGLVVSGDDLDLVNPLLREEGRLCTGANSRAEAVRSLARRTTGTAADEATLVGIDPRGLDIRARIGILRVEFARPAPTPEGAQAALESLLAEAERAAP